MPGNSAENQTNYFLEGLSAAPKSTGTIPFRYYNVIRNCGDAITSYIISKNFGLTARVAQPKEQHLLAIGSIFFMANRNSHIWGSGVLTPKNAIPEIDPTKIYALRGKNTVAHLRSLGHTIPDVPLGDPGILIDGLTNSTKGINYKAAVIPHHTGFSSKKWDAVRANKEMCLVDMMDDTLLPLQQMAESEVVISQSLHGLIFAAALGKPYLWISGHSDDVWNFKFLDWFTTCENGQNEPVLLNVDFDEMLKRAELRPCTANKSDLLAAFPSNLTDGEPQARGDFHINRLLSPFQAFVVSSSLEHVEDGNYSPQALAESVGKIRSKVFAGAPEPTYLAITTSDSTPGPTRARLMDGQKYLDQNRDVSFIWYSKGAVESVTAGFKVSSNTFSEAYLKDGTILVRPDGYMPLNKKFAHI